VTTEHYYDCAFVTRGDGDRVHDLEEISRYENVRK